ncbi:hypothetical protein BV22DRAFT_1041689 [Leucogyrophana mollusca]|uniref:Uncharacterized protein n=1 Tax=Leucogyrophana mollusca TaxID=85980 RepID=A0ACB8AZ42_9AGAM|nr:hypothetical protein BV22DRAFT_1041689 [Leucogyrophana mollusca]
MTYLDQCESKPRAGSGSRVPGGSPGPGLLRNCSPRARCTLDGSGRISPRKVTLCVPLAIPTWLMNPLVMPAPESWYWGRVAHRRCDLLVHNPSMLCGRLMLLRQLCFWGREDSSHINTKYTALPYVVSYHTVWQYHLSDLDSVEGGCHGRMLVGSYDRRIWRG